LGWVFDIEAFNVRFQGSSYDTLEDVNPCVVRNFPPPPPPPHGVVNRGVGISPSLLPSGCADLIGLRPVSGGSSRTLRDSGLRRPEVLPVQLQGYPVKIF
jgi:hypothetical protein